MGAFTLKVSAYQARPWELAQVRVPNYFRVTSNDPAELFFQIRSNIQVLRIQSAGWITDRIRFAADGFRRQRLTSLWVNDRRVSWATGLSVWWSLTVGHFFWWRTDAWLVAHASTLRLYQLLQRGRRPAVISFDMYVVSAVYHGVYGYAGLNQYSGVVLPGCHPYEEDKVLRAPAGITRWQDWSLALANIIGSVKNQTKQKINLLDVTPPKHSATCQNVRSYTPGAFACLKVSGFQQLITLL